MTMLDDAETYSKPLFDKTAGQYSQLIGYWDNSDGVRVRRRFYFGSNIAAAIIESKKQQKAWKKLVEDHKSRETAMIRLTPEYQRTLAKWPKKNATPQQSGTTVSGNHTPDLSTVTIAAAKDLFLASKKSLVGLAGGVGIKATTYNGLNTVLNIALGISTAKANAQRKGRDPITRKPIDINMRLCDLTRTDLEKFRNFWMALPDGIKARTAANYCVAFKALIDWADTEESLRFNKPKSTDMVFNFKGIRKPKVVKVTTEQLKTLLDAASLTPKTLLYCLLALQCGHYQADIGNLLRSELRIINGEPFLYRKRTKMTDVNEAAIEADEEGDQYVLTYLWPETYRLLQTYMAPADHPSGRLLLNERGELLWDEKVDGPRKDAISDAYRRTRETAKMDLNFRQIRKIGWNAMKRIGGTDDFARKWAGQMVQGIAKWYNFDEFGDVTEALKKWRNELIAEKVLQEVKASS